MRVFQLDNYFSCDFNDKTLTTYSKSKGKIKPHLPEIVSEKITLENTDALQAEVHSFIESIIKNTYPFVTAKEGRDALEIALEITKKAETRYNKF